MGEPDPPASARLSTGVRVHDHDQQHRYGRAGGDGGLPLPLARARALSDLARDGPHHRARHPRSPGGADRAHARSPRTGRQSASSMPACTASSFPSSALRPSRSRPPRRVATRPWAGADPAPAWPAHRGPIRMSTPTRRITTCSSWRSSRRSLRLRMLTKLPRRPASMSCSPGPATCRSLSDCGATSATLSSRSRRR